MSTATMDKNVSTKHLFAASSKWCLLIILATVGFIYVTNYITAKHTYDFSPVAGFPNRYNSAILYLACQNKIDEASKSLRLLFKNFNTKYRYPVIIFYDENGGKFRSTQLLKEAGLSLVDEALIEFVLVEFVFPDGITIQNKSTTPVWSQGFPGYQHMIAFWSYHVFHHPRINTLEYYWRLDTDSFLFEPVKVDFIEKLRQNNVHYAYRAEGGEPDGVVLGMAQFVGKYVRANNLTVAQPQKLKRILEANTEFQGFTTYYNNFEIVHVPTFLRHDMEQFRKAIYDTKRIYTHRWGDAPQRYLMVNLFLNASEVYKVCECAYEHQEFMHEPASC